VRASTDIQRDHRIAGPAQRRTFARAGAGADERGFTLVEMSTSIAVLLVVLTAAWMLLTVSNDNLNHIENGGQASELNRAALDTFQRDLNHAVLPAVDVSPILYADSTQCSMLVEQTSEGGRELITWRADVSDDALLRVVTQPIVSDPDSLEDFEGGASETTVMLKGLDWNGSEGEGMFSYRPDALNNWDNSPRSVGLITFHLRNGMPDANTNVIDRTASFRVLALVINGYSSPED
jgi:prepilin-type N-terminal cleavage/methylation domain-containing protein